LVDIADSNICLQSVAMFVPPSYLAGSFQADGVHISWNWACKESFSGSNI